MRVLLVDDQKLLLEGMRHLLSAHGIEVIGAARDGLQALQMARTLSPDLILMDVHMPECGGLEATRLIKAEMPRIKVVMLSVSGEDEDLFEAIKAGASGYLLKSLEAEEFMDLLSSLDRGDAPLAPGLATRILEEFARQRPPTQPPPATDDAKPRADLTDRQREILALVAQGKSYRAIGEMLYLTERTIKYHMAQIMERLHLENRAQAIAYAQRTGLTESKSEDQA